MPDYLRKLPAAQDVWFEELERVIAHGVTADHSSTLATYCCLEAQVRTLFASGEVPRAAFLSERRKLAELLGIGGLSGRTSAGTTNPLDPNGNAFASLPEG